MFYSFHKYSFLGVIIDEILVHVNTVLWFQYLVPKDPFCT